MSDFKYPIGRIESHYYSRFSLGIGIIVGQFMFSRFQGVMTGVAVIILAVVIRIYQGDD